MYGFEYQRPSSVADAVRTSSADARYLAGGQSLVQSMKLRLASASTLVDLASIAGLRGISRDGSAVKIGAMTRHSEVARSPEVRSAIPALAELAESIGDPMVRNQGTIGGSLANADPAADYPAATLGLGATIETDRRSIAADDFFVDLFTTALQAGELIVAVRFPMAKRAAYVKLRQPASRFALVGVFVSQGDQGVRVAVTGARSYAFRVREMEQALEREFSPESISGVKVDPAGCNSDLHGSAEYRAAMIGVLAQRAVAKAREQ
ncbi:MAG: xanthine dehydrogenase family protein subunit M [Burkholderiaceae bacterium]|nr:xanthine dehydrogenase family protein subunit M [Burkholderiaceae bacterium]